MKRKLLILLMTAGILTGCSTAPVADKANVNVPMDPVPAQVQTVPTSTIRYQVELTSFERSAAAEDGQLLATYQARVPVMTAVREDGTPIEGPMTSREKKAVEAAETFNQRFAVWTSEDSFQELADSAREELDLRRENGLLPIESYDMDLSCTVYQTGHLVSVAGLCYSYTGGAHPNTWQLGWNFDLKTGTFFDGEAISADTSGFREAVAAELLWQARERAKENNMEPEEMYWPEYETLLTDWVNFTVYFDSTGMTVAFSPYELAAYAVGAQEFHLSYDWLRPLLDEESCEVLELTSPENGEEP